MTVDCLTELVDYHCAAPLDLRMTEGGVRDVAAASGVGLRPRCKGRMIVTSAGGVGGGGIGGQTHLLVVDSVLDQTMLDARSPMLSGTCSAGSCSSASILCHSPAEADMAVGWYKRRLELAFLYGI